MDYEYTISDFKELEAALMRSGSVSHGSPDRYQYYQNELSKHIANFLLKPYQTRKLEKKEERYLQ